jgi:hypothetical protein
VRHHAAARDESAQLGAEPAQRAADGERQGGGDDV